MNQAERQKLVPPGGQTKVLLHSCCAPCSGEVMEAMLASGIDYTIYFYNPNIHPVREYELRKEENVRFAEKHGVTFVDADYDKENWFARARGHGVGAGARHPLHDVLRHALRAHRALRARARISGDDQLTRHLALEEHGADQR